MSRELAAGKAMRLLDDLKGTVEELAARSQKLNDEHQVKVSKQKRRAEAFSEEETTRLATALGELDAALHQARTAAQARFEQRKIKIGKAFQASKEQGLKNVDDEVGARKYELQKRMLHAERDRDNSLAAAHKSLEDFRAGLAAEQEELARLESSAQRAFGGYRSLRRSFRAAYEKAGSFSSPDENKSLAEMRALMSRAADDLKRFRHNPVVAIFKFLPAWLLLALLACALGAVPLLQRAGVAGWSFREAGIAAAVLAAMLLARLAGRWRAQPLARKVSDALAQARRLHDACHTQSETHYHQELERVKKEYQSITGAADQDLKKVLAQAGERRVACRMGCDTRTVRANQSNERLYSSHLQRLERQHGEMVLQLKRAAEARIQSTSSASDNTLAELTRAYDATWNELQKLWQERTSKLYAGLATLQAEAQKLFPEWSEPGWKKWTPPARFAEAARFAQLNVDLSKFCAALPKDPRLALPGPTQFAVPLCLAYPEQGSLLFETGPAGHDEAIGALNNVILRLLSVTPPGRANFTIFDPVGLGQNFAGVMHLADFEEQLINSRIWTQSGQLEQKLADLNEHMEKVIQMYLRNEYQTIAEYNEQAGVIAEKYQFLVVADFPANFTDTAIKRLLSIAASGARCGVYMLIHWDHRQAAPQDFIPDELRRNSLTVALKGMDFILPGWTRPGAQLALDAPPSAEQATEFVLQVGRLSRDSSRVEVPFEHVVPPESEVWSEDTRSELRVPIGRTGATKLQYLAIGKGTCQHGLVAGKTGSGKSTLFHVIITNLALWCSPEQVEFYLVDFKKGVEFKCYGAKRLPHARVVAIESDREFGLSVLQRVDDELRRRGDLFRALGVQDVAGYKRAGGTEPMPRTLLLIDEFQEFFVEDDRIAQTASLLLDRIVRQGRAFGIHVLLGSQTLGGAYTVARTTLGQMVIRIALQCNEADAYLIMDDTNPAPRLLSRPGEGIYNDMAGALEGNSPFQAVWLPDDVRDKYLTKVRERADRNGKEYPGPLVFEGNAPADIRENTLFTQLLESPPATAPPAARMWLGAPNSIKGPTEALFQRQSGNNLLIVGQRDEAILAIFSVGLAALAAQYAPGQARFILLDATPAGTPAREYLERVVDALHHPVAMPKPGDVGPLMKELAEEMKRRGDDVNAESTPPVFLFIHDLQKFAKLRYEEDFGFSGSGAEEGPNPAAVLNDIVCEGTRLGLHVIANTDTYNNVTRFLSRKALSEFEMRVLFQMSVNDSASLIDSPKAGNLGLHRALFYNAQEGYLETFRPYALPATDWVAATDRALDRLANKPA